VFDLTKVKFEHDNRVDLLTGADMQTNFYRHLLRAMSVRRRNGGALFIVTVRVIAPSREYKVGSPASKEQVKKYEEELKRSSLNIKKNLRAEDFYTRMAVDGFYILISGDKDEESKLSERFKKLFADRSLYQVGSYRLIGDPSPTDWLSEIDDQYFAPHNPK
jgi:GGDEF domain-containing protein